MALDILRHSNWAFTSFRVQAKDFIYARDT